MTASTYISDFASELSKIFNKVNVYSTAGNHGRCMPNKEDSLKGENLDMLIPFYMKARLQNYSNIVIHGNEVEESVAMFTVRGNLVNSCHGDKDSVSNVVQRFTMMFNAKPSVVLMGHRHTNGMTTVYNTKVIESGCVSGNDNYCLDKRLLGRPEQTVLVMNNDGIECLYDIQLD
jgi:UDP-2,3-diacylglucosamine pyrophosphatase LpxH